MGLLSRVGEWQGHVPKPDGKKEIIKRNYVTKDIQTLIIYADQYNATKGYVKKIAHLLRGRNDKETIHNIYKFIRLNVAYVKDEQNNDTVKTVNATLYDGFGDCKVMTGLGGALCRELGIPYKIRFTSYDNNNRVSHVYIVALADGKEVILDPVYWMFNREIPFDWCEDYPVFKKEYFDTEGVNGGFAETVTNGGIGKIVLFTFITILLLNKIK